MSASRVQRAQALAHLRAVDQQVPRVHPVPRKARPWRLASARSRTRGAGRCCPRRRCGCRSRVAEVALATSPSTRCASPGSPADAADRSTGLLRQCVALPQLVGVRVPLHQVLGVDLPQREVAGSRFSSRTSTRAPARAPRASCPRAGRSRGRSRSRSRPRRCRRRRRARARAAAGSSPASRGMCSVARG